MALKPKKQREQIIKEHMENFTTKYYESDRRWHSFLPDDTHPRKQRPIAKRKWEDLEKAIIDFYESQKADEKRKKITLRTLYPEWFEYKWQDTNNSNYMKHIDGEWKRFYLKDGELLSLKWKDLKESYLHIRRMEQRQYTRDEEENWQLHIKIVEHTKSDAGNRTIYVVSSALEISKLIKESNLNNGYKCGPEFSCKKCKNSKK